MAPLLIIMSLSIDFLEPCLIAKKDCKFIIGSNPQVQHILRDQRISFKIGDQTYYFVGGVRYAIVGSAMHHLWAYSRFMTAEARKFINDLADEFYVHC